MKIEQLPLITLEMIRPEKRSRETDAAFGALVYHLYGSPGQEFIEGVKEGRLTANSRRDFKDRVNGYFFRAFQATYGTYGTVTPETAYDEAGKTALGVISDLADLTGLSVSQDPFVDEINPHAPSPIDLLYHLARLDQGRNIDLDFNVRRHYWLLNIAASIESTSGGSHIRDVLSDMQFKLDEKLYYRGEEGYHQNYQAYSYQDVETNRFVGFASVSPQLPRFPNPPNMRLLRHEFLARRIEGVGLVYTIRNQKDLVAATKKAIAKADNNGGVVKPEHIEDHMRMTCIALEGSFPKRNRGRVDQVERVHKRVVEFYNEYKGIKEIVPDNETDGDRGQANAPFRRDKVYLDDTNIPLESVVISEANYYDQTYAVGKEDPASGLYDGPAHRLYEIRRDKPVAKGLLPERIYHVDVNRALAVRSHETAERLKHMVEVTVYNPRQRLEEIRNGEVTRPAHSMFML